MAVDCSVAFSLFHTHPGQTRNLLSRRHHRYSGSHLVSLATGGRGHAPQSAQRRSRPARLG